MQRDIFPFHPLKERAIYEDLMSLFLMTGTGPAQNWAVGSGPQLVSPASQPLPLPYASLPSPRLHHKLWVTEVISAITN